MESMTLKAPPSLAEMVKDQMRRRILDGRYEVGGKVPSENEMMAMFGVSRTVVREALSALRDSGFITSKQGKGSFVISRDAHEPFSIAPDEVHSLSDVLDILELRSVLEIKMTTLAAQRAQPHHIAAIRQALRDFDREIEADGDGIEADRNFHLAIAEASGNPHFPRLLRSFGTLLIARKRIQTQFRSEEDRRSYLLFLSSEHGEILSAIERHDAEKAEELMTSHLEGSRYRIMKRVNSEPRNP